MDNQQTEKQTDLLAFLEQYENGEVISYEPDGPGEVNADYQFAMACYRLGYLAPAWTPSTTANSFKITPQGLQALGMIRLTRGKTLTVSTHPIGGKSALKEMLVTQMQGNEKQGNLSPLQVAILQRFEDSPYTWLSYAPVGLPYYPNGSPDFREDQVNDLNDLVLMGLLIGRDDLWGSSWTITDAGRTALMQNKATTEKQAEPAIKKQLSAALKTKVTKAPIFTYPSPNGQRALKDLYHNWLGGTMAIQVKVGTDEDRAMDELYGRGWIDRFEITDEAVQRDWEVYGVNLTLAGVTAAKQFESENWF